MRKKIIVFSQCYTHTTFEQRNYYVDNEKNIDIKKPGDASSISGTLKRNFIKTIEDISDDTYYIIVRLGVCEINNEFWIDFIKQLYHKKSDIPTSINYNGILTEDQKTVLNKNHPKMLIIDNNNRELINFY